MPGLSLHHEIPGDSNVLGVLPDERQSNRNGIERLMYYKCSGCSSPRGNPVILRSKTEVKLTIHYQSGCKMVLKQKKGSWSIVNKVCKSDL